MTTKQAKSTREDGMPAGHPLQKLARCTNHEESDDVFWDIMDWNSEDERTKKAKQKSEKMKGNTPRQGTGAANQPSPSGTPNPRQHLRGLDPRKAGAASAEPRAPASTSSSSRGGGDPTQEQAIRAQAVAQRKAVEKCSDWEPKLPARYLEPHGQRSPLHRVRSGARTQGDSMRTAIKMDKRAQRRWEK